MMAFLLIAISKDIIGSVCNIHQNEYAPEAACNSWFLSMSRIPEVFIQDMGTSICLWIRSIFVFITIISKNMFP